MIRPTFPHLGIISFVGTGIRYPRRACAPCLKFRLQITAKKCSLGHHVQVRTHTHTRTHTRTHKSTPTPTSRKRIPTHSNTQPQPTLSNTRIISWCPFIPHGCSQEKIGHVGISGTKTCCCLLLLVVTCFCLLLLAAAYWVEVVAVAGAGGR